MSKTPYEIRFDILRMAKEMLDTQYETSREFALEAAKTAARANEDLYASWAEYTPKMFSPTELIKQAEELQKFINNKKD